MLYLMESTSWKYCSFNTKFDAGRYGQINHNRNLVTVTSPITKIQFSMNCRFSIHCLAYESRQDTWWPYIQISMWYSWCLTPFFFSGTPKTRYIHHFQITFAANWKVNHNILQYFRDYKNGSIKSVYVFVTLLLQRRSKTVLQNVV